MAKCPDVVTGSVEIPGEDYILIQETVDRGRNLWRLDPARTAQVVGKLFGLEETDKYTLIQRYYDPGSGLQHATVRVKHGSCTYILELYQPVKQGSKGIWVLQSITPL
ncbi:hypothetical protein [Alicyclobacillus mengziensis]|uniref:Uncharacterized protein n=1 Tax=Alicyclobacillus mengziensis TaxID=2931921 RepID=A0A9X7W131_9BACL|nr:hypothetical protein [Alicyclobacillus mengziensis]QSO48823.1 hypothetical protein JZ786_07685 [Alicyclobacillus mengziensis]